MSNHRRRSSPWVATALTGTLMLASCSGGDASTASPLTSSETPADDVSESEASQSTPPSEVAFDVGVTEAPCPNAVNPENGCIYLGQLSDLTEGPFAAVGPQFVEATNLFWARVNEMGGVGGQFDVDSSTYVRDNKYNPQEQVARYREIEPEILAVAQSLGTSVTLAIQEDMASKDIVGVPSSLWSGWEFTDNLLPSGHSYCVEAMNGLDWAAAKAEVSTVMSVHYPGDYGGDSLGGVVHWAEANGVEFDASVHDIQTLPNAQAGSQDDVVDALTRVSPDVVVIATGAREMAEIVGKAVAQGFEGQFIGALPSYNNAVLEGSSGQAIQDQYVKMGFFAPWGSDTDAHRAMEDALGGEPPASDFFILGWLWQYPLKSVLEEAHGRGDLTRAGVRQVVADVSVDYEGLLPERQYGDPAQTAFRQSTVDAADAGATLGSRQVADFFAGPTVLEFAFDEPCVGVG